MPGLMPRALGLTLVLGFGLLNPNCGNNEPAVVQGEQCYFEDPGDPMLPPRDVEVGLLAGDDFRPYDDGEQVELIAGFQGFEMITPYVELPAIAADGEEACWWVGVEYVLDSSGDTIGGSSGGMVFERIGDVMRAGPVFEPMFEYGTMLMRVTVVGDDFVAVDEVMIEIEG